jgi:hypothetical protein
MRPVLDSEKLETGRFRNGQLASETGDLYGLFDIMGPCGTALRIMSSGTGREADGWEHVSISTQKRPPNWQEMCFVKDLFWDEDEIALQYHPPKWAYVNHHPYCLHLWKPLNEVIPLPPTWMVGPLQSRP